MEPKNERLEDGMIVLFKQVIFFKLGFMLIFQAARLPPISKMVSFLLDDDKPVL